MISSRVDLGGEPRDLIEVLPLLRIGIEPGQESVDSEDQLGVIVRYGGMAAKKRAVGSRTLEAVLGHFDRRFLLGKRIAAG